VHIVGVPHTTPTAEQIAEAWDLTKGKNVLRVEDAWVLRRWKEAPAYINVEEATLLLAMESANTVERVMELWRNPNVRIIDEEAGFEKILWDRFIHFFSGYTVVKGNKCWCEVFCKTTECSHVAGILQCEGHGNFFQQPLPRAPPCPGRTPAKAAKRKDLVQCLEDESTQPAPVQNEGQEQGRPSSSACDADSGGPQSQAASATAAPGAPTFFLANDTVDCMHRLFQDSDDKGLEAMCWWLGPVTGTTVTVALYVDQEVQQCSVETTAQGNVQLAGFLANHPDLAVLAWCHSHHDRLLPTPSAADVCQQWIFHDSFKKPNFGMAIAWRGGQFAPRGGLEVWRIPPKKREALRHRRGQIFDGTDPVTYLQQCFVDKSSVVLNIVKLGVLQVPSKVLQGKPKAMPQTHMASL